MVENTFQWFTYGGDTPHTDTIDVRSPAEFAHDHVAGAVNLPVLTDDERAHVGTLYRSDPFTARKVGAALIARNVAAMLEGPLRERDGTFFPLVYCWRGGQRSQSLALILSQVGFRVSVLAGGYRAYRQEIVSRLETLPENLDLRILAGLTGTSKTRILENMAAAGAQVLNLEGLANHRGSLLGQPVRGGQPTQKAFESRLVPLLANFDPGAPVWVESESNQIGAIHVPAALWKRMRAARVVQVTAPMKERVAYLIDEYSYFCSDPGLLKERITWLVRVCGEQKIRAWGELIDQAEWPRFVEEILKVHYDPAYTRSMKRWAGQIDETHHLEGLGPLELDAFVSEILNPRRS